MEALNLQHLLTRFSDHWSQRTIGTLNDYEIKLAKLLGESVWHSHKDTDEMFLIIYGTLNIQLRDRDVILKPGEVFVVPRGVEHVRNIFWPLLLPYILVWIAKYTFGLHAQITQFLFLNLELDFTDWTACSVRKRTRKSVFCCWSLREW